MRLKFFSVIAAVTILVAASSSFAQGRGNGSKPQAAGPKPNPASTVSKPQGGGGSTKAPKASGPKTAKPQGGSAGKAKPQSASAKPAKGGTSVPGATGEASTSAAKKPKTKDAAAAPATEATGTSPAATATLSPVQQKLEKNTQLAAKVQARLPAGTDVQDAAAGFRNLGQFVAAVNVSSNLGIPFAEVKSHMTGDEALSLGKTIKKLRPTADSGAEARKAQRQADAMIGSTKD